MQVSDEGYLDGLDKELYHGNICDAPSISSSGIKDIMDYCPRYYWANSYMNPDRPEREPNRNFDIGSAAHLLALEGKNFEANILRVPFDKYSTNDSKNLRKLAYDTGKIPLLTDEVVQVMLMRAELMKDPIAAEAFSQEGVSERSYFWKCKKTGIWKKCRTDREARDLRFIADYKTTTCANPDDFKKSVYEYGYFISQPWYLEGIEQVTGIMPENYYLIAQEKKYPYLVATNRLTAQAVAKGIMYMEKGAEVFAECVETGVWPGYRDPNHPKEDGVIELDLASGALYAIADKEERGDFALKG